MTVSRPICISIICISVVIISPSRQRQCTASPSGGLFQSAQTATAPSIVVVCKNSTCALRSAHCAHCFCNLSLTIRLRLVLQQHAQNTIYHTILPQTVHIFHVLPLPISNVIHWLAGCLHARSNKVQISDRFYHTSFTIL